MALEKQTVTLNFAKGLDTINDPNQLPLGKFTQMENSIFVKSEGIGRLEKRNGFGELASLPDGSARFVTTFGQGLVAIGDNVYTYSQGANRWATKNAYLSCQLSVTPIVNNQTNKLAAFSAISPNGLMCATFLDQVATSGSTSCSVSLNNASKYCVVDAGTGAMFTPPTLISPTFGQTLFYTKVFHLGNYFVVVFDGTTSSQSHLQYFTIQADNPSVVSGVSTVTTDYLSANPSSFDGVVHNNTLYLAWATRTTGSSIQVATVSSALAFSSSVAISSVSSKAISMTVDTMGSATIWVGGMSRQINPASSNSQADLFGVALKTDLSIRSTRTVRFPSGLVGSCSGLNNTVAVINGGMRLYYETYDTFSAIGANGEVVVTPTGFPLDYAINQWSTFYDGTANSTTTRTSGVALGSRAFHIGSAHYYLTAYQSNYQSTYFLCNSAGLYLGKLAPSIAGGYYGNGLPSASVIGSSCFIPYVFAKTITSVNKGTNLSSSTQTVGIYSQTGLNLSKLTFDPYAVSAAEAGGNLNISGDMLWGYDGVLPVESGFHLYPETVVASLGSASSAAGSMTAQSYFYRAVYQWTDNKGMTHQSAPSIPINVNVPSGIGGTLVFVPGLRITSRDYAAYPTKIALYRWSTAQPVYYQVTQVVAPSNVFNPVTPGGIRTFPLVTFYDTTSDSVIQDNDILYTEGGIVENIAPPAPRAMATFDSRLWTINAENENELWFSKALVAGQPVEMSDLFTYFVPPSTSTGQHTGGVKSLAQMDDKLILFKKNSIYYIAGRGPDDTGANFQYSDPIFISSGVSCSNPNSTVLTPLGLMFESEGNGIWLLNRSLSLEYVGIDVDSYRNLRVRSALLIPNDTEVRFILEDGTELVYDYAVQQWGTFTGLSGISGTIFNDRQTIISVTGSTFQETPGVYKDGQTPVTMSFSTGWISLAGVQGFQRAYSMYWLGNYQSPHTFTVGIKQNYQPDTVQSVTVAPPIGSTSSVEQWKIGFQHQKCQSFMISFNETSSSTAGAGLTLSGIDLVVGLKKGYPKNLGIGNKAK